MIERVVRFVAQVVAKKAVLAVFAIIQKGRVLTGNAVLAEVRLIALCTIDRVHTAVTAFYKNTIPAVS